MASYLDFPIAPAASVVPLSLRLRSETSELHREIEGWLAFPGSIRDVAAYRACLISYFRLYSPIESSLRSFRDWEANSIRLEERLQSPRLVSDLASLGIEPDSCSEAGPEWLPPMPDFAHALGVFYVLEGSTLGGRFILRDLRQSLGAGIEGADAFFNGHGPNSAAMWGAAKTAIDNYGQTHPESCGDVIEGAQSTFRSVGNWLLSSR